MVMLSVPELFAASYALTVIVLLPETSATLQLHELVPLAVTVLPFAAFVQVTCVTPTLSLALPPREIGVEVVL